MAEHISTRTDGVIQLADGLIANTTLGLLAFSNQLTDDNINNYLTTEDLNSVESGRNYAWIDEYPKMWKFYVDSKISTLGTIYKVSGNKTLDEILALDLSDGTLKGNVYNVSSVGEDKTVGTIPSDKSASGKAEDVYIGDQILINQDGLLDNLRGFIDLTAYQTKAIGDTVVPGQTTVEGALNWLYNNRGNAYEPGKGIGINNNTITNTGAITITYDDVEYTPSKATTDYGDVSIPAPTANKGIKKEDVINDFDEKENSNYRTENAILVECDDAASFLLGGNWRIPNRYEFQTLLNISNITYETIGNQTKFTFTSKITNNSLTFRFDTSNPLYWCDDQESDDAAKAFHANFIGTWDGQSPRWMGYHIRPITTDANAEGAVDMGTDGIYWCDSDLKDDTSLMIEDTEGDLYAWAETNTKDSFSLENYKYKPLDPQELACSKYNKIDKLKSLITMTYYRWDEQGIRREVNLSTSSGDTIKVTQGDDGHILYFEINGKTQTIIIPDNDTQYSDYSGTTHGLVPAAPSDKQNKFLNANGQWSEVTQPKVQDVQINNTSIVDDSGVANFTTMQITCWDDTTTETKRTFNFVVNQ